MHWLLKSYIAKKTSFKNYGQAIKSSQTGRAADGLLAAPWPTSNPWSRLVLGPALVTALPTCPLGYKHPDGKSGADSRFRRS